MAACPAFGRSGFADGRSPAQKQPAAVGLRNAACGPQSKGAVRATCPFGTNGVPIRAVASRPLWIPREVSPCDPALRAGTLRGAFGGGVMAACEPFEGTGYGMIGRALTT